MAIVKLKVLDHAGHTLAASQAGESAALVPALTQIEVYGTENF